MPRFVLAFALCGLALYGPTAAHAGAKAEGDELSRCLDPSTKLEAGGEVKQSSKDSKTIARVNAASSNLTAEAGRRKSGH